MAMTGYLDVLESEREVIGALQINTQIRRAQLEFMANHIGLCISGYRSQRQVERMLADALLQTRHRRAEHLDEYLRMPAREVTPPEPSPTRVGQHL